MSKNSLEFTEEEQLVHREQKKTWSGSTFSQDSGPYTRKQENTQLVEPYERTYHWHKTMMRVCHIKLQITSRNELIPHHKGFQQLHDEFKQKAGELQSA